MLNSTLGGWLLTAGSALALTHGGSVPPPPTYGGPGGYGGPGDFVPPPGSGGAGGGGGGAGAPGSPGPSAPATPGASRPIPPTQPASPGSPSTPKSPGSPKTGSAESMYDWTAWQMWWNYNRHDFLEVRRSLARGQPATGSDDFFLSGAGSDRDSLAPDRQALLERVVPALVATLERGGSKDLMSSALVALARTQDRAGLTIWSHRLLTSREQELSETAALCLGIARDPRQIDLALALARNDRATLIDRFRLSFSGDVALRTRAFAVWSLGLIGERALEYDRLRVVNALRQVFDESAGGSSLELPLACVVSMGLVGLRAETASPRTAGASRLLTTLDEELDWLAKQVDDPKQERFVRAQSLCAMGRLLRGNPQSPLRTRVIEQALKHFKGGRGGEVQLMQAAALVLGQVGDGDADPLDRSVRSALAEAQSSGGDQQTRFFARMSLARVASRAGLGAAPALDGFVSAKSVLEDGLRSGSQADRAWTALALGLLARGARETSGTQCESIHLALRRSLLEARSNGELSAAALALGLARDLGSSELLLERLDQAPDPETRGFVALALGLVGAFDALDPIRAELARSRNDANLLRMSAVAMGLLGDRRVVDELVRWMGEVRSIPAQAALASALGLLGDARALDPLLALVRDVGRPEMARAFAASALGLLCDGEERAFHAGLSIDCHYRAASESLTSPGLGNGLLEIL